MDLLMRSRIKELVVDLAQHRVDAIVATGRNGRLTKEEIALALSDYPGAITEPPEEAYDSVRLYDVHDEESGRRNAEFDLWYDGKESDLTLSLEIQNHKELGFLVVIDNIHVL